MHVHARHPNRCGAKRPDVPHPVEGHQSGAHRAQGSLGSGLQVPAASEGPSWEAGFGLSEPADRGVHPWVLLARALVPEGADSVAERGLLEGQVRFEQGQGQEKRAAAPASRLVGAHGLGVFARDFSLTGGGNPPAAVFACQKAGPGPVGILSGGCGNASPCPGVADNLGKITSPRPGDVSGGENQIPVGGVLAESNSSPPMDTPDVPNRPTFIDLFSGCGGLSLGLSQAGWQGVFAVERAKDAFETFRANFLSDASRYPFNWPDWLAKSAHSIDDVLDDHLAELKRLRGKIDLIAGGPPCQGFSFAGRRNRSDPRNKMFHRYVSVVGLVNPKFLVLENVPGMNVAHTKRGNKPVRSGQTFYDKLRAALADLGYIVGEMVLDAADHGVPQRRERLVVIGIRADVARSLPTGCTGVFNGIDLAGEAQLAAMGDGQPITALQAISDLQVGVGRQRAKRTEECVGSGGRGRYVQPKYEGPHDVVYQKAMNEGVGVNKMDSTRLANHKPEVAERFRRILARCRRGVNLSKEDRDRFGMLKHRTVPMAADEPAPTLTTLPDDILHFCEPRILSVREYARLQSFPDWFEFKGKYTTGGELRKVECPRYTQVGNAVPPLMAKSIGTAILQALRSSLEKGRDAAIASSGKHPEAAR